jgi:hypothetical protein
MKILWRRRQRPLDFLRRGRLFSRQENVMLEVFLLLALAALCLHLLVERWRNRI